MCNSKNLPATIERVFTLSSMKKKQLMNFRQFYEATESTKDETYVRIFNKKTVK